MSMNLDKSVPFDPGFVQHISAVIPSLQYVYGNLNKYRNFGQKKNQFKMMFPKLEAMIHNYIGFYAGCILWAEYIKTLDDKPITGNYCCGAEYNEEETLQEVRFLKEYFEMLPKDVKYYMGKDYSINPVWVKVLDLYEEFLKVNEGFVNVEKTADLKLPDGVNPIQDNKRVLEKIEDVIETGRLFELIELAE